MGCSTAFFFLRVGSMHEKYKTALCITGLVTFIAMYHYFRIFNSFEAAYTPCQKIDGVVNYNICDAEKFGYNPTGIPFNDAYRYVDWLLTVPMLLIEIILVMGLSAEETKSRCTTLGLSAALMIAFGYPGEVTGEVAPRMLFWFISWCTYPIVYLFPVFSGNSDGKAGLTAVAMTSVQIGYTVSDLISKCGVGFLVY